MTATGKLSAGAIGFRERQVACDVCGAKRPRNAKPHNAKLCDARKARIDLKAQGFLPAGRHWRICERHNLLVRTIANEVYAPRWAIDGLDDGKDASWLQHEILRRTIAARSVPVDGPPPSNR